MTASTAYQIQDSAFSDQWEKFNLDIHDSRQTKMDLLFNFNDYLDAISKLDGEREINKLFDMICEYDELGVIDGRKEGDPSDLNGYAQYTLNLLVNMYPEILENKYKKLKMEWKLAR